MQAALLHSLFYIWQQSLQILVSSPDSSDPCAVQAMHAVEAPLAETIRATYRAEAARQARHAHALGMPHAVYCQCYRIVAVLWHVTPPNRHEALSLLGHTIISERDLFSDIAD